MYTHTHNIILCYVYITCIYCTHQKATEYMAKRKKKRRPVRMPVKNPFLSPSLVAISSFWLNRFTSFFSPAKASTVRMEERTSSATAPAPAYCFCSLLVNTAVTWSSSQYLITALTLCHLRMYINNCYIIYYTCTILYLVLYIHVHVYYIILYTALVYPLREHRNLHILWIFFTGIYNYNNIYAYVYTCI